jgi:hypothetical protein
VSRLDCFNGESLHNIDVSGIRRKWLTKTWYTHSRVSTKYNTTALESRDLPERFEQDSPPSSDDDLGHLKHLQML